MQVKLLNITPNAEEHIVEIARVSSSRKDKKSKSAGLLRYLVKHKHWSPFEHSHATFEIETSKAIGIQLIRHRSFSFQEFSQRYQDVNKLESMFIHCFTVYIFKFRDKNTKNLKTLFRRSPFHIYFS